MEWLYERVDNGVWKGWKIAYEGMGDWGEKGWKIAYEGMAMGRGEVGDGGTRDIVWRT